MSAPTASGVFGAAVAFQPGACIRLTETTLGVAGQRRHDRLNGVTVRPP